MARNPKAKTKTTGPVIVKKKLTLARQTAKPFAFFFTLPPVPFTKPIYYNAYRLLF
jgi:hypothetical protein